MYVGKHFAGCTFEDILHRVEETVVIDENGFGEFWVEDGSVSVWKPQEGQVIGERKYFTQNLDVQQEEENQEDDQEEIQEEDVVETQESEEE